MGLALRGVWQLVQGEVPQYGLADGRIAAPTHQLAGTASKATRAELTWSAEKGGQRTTTGRTVHGSRPSGNPSPPSSGQKWRPGANGKSQNDESAAHPMPSTQRPPPFMLSSKWSAHQRCKRRCRALDWHSRGLVVAKWVVGRWLVWGSWCATLHKWRGPTGDLRVGKWK